MGYFPEKKDSNIEDTIVSANQNSQDDFSQADSITTNLEVNSHLRKKLLILAKIVLTFSFSTRCKRLIS